MATPSYLTHLLKMERLLLNNISKRFSGSLWNGVEGRILVTAGCNLVHGIRKTFHTSISLDKRQSPRTVGIPAWRKASIDRKEFVSKLRKPKSEETIKAEMRLEKQEKDLSLFTSSRIRNLPKEKETVNRLQPEVFLSRDENTVVCYHPVPNYPKEKTRLSWERPSWFGEPNVVSLYSDEMTMAQEDEARKLRDSDPRLWTASTLGHMMKVKPSIINDKIPLTSEQRFELEIEKKLLLEWGKEKRQDYTKYQILEILDYIRETRGETAVKDYRKVFNF
ncbi:uncharacterized protein LOC135692488 [Rhopilema esculentum]|uniref:uncharacterized protein LOC135692488 n=1 Tax=Rhopilema esculentum TaxID=499914 RepID=UPI0031D22CD0